MGFGGFFSLSPVQWTFPPLYQCPFMEMIRSVHTLQSDKCSCAWLDPSHAAVSAVGCSSCNPAQNSLYMKPLAIAVDVDTGSWSSECGAKTWAACCQPRGFDVLKFLMLDEKGILSYGEIVLEETDIQPSLTYKYGSEERQIRCADRQDSPMANCPSGAKSNSHPVTDPFYVTLCYLYMIDQNDYESSNPCSYCLEMQIFQNWDRGLVLLEEKPAKPGVTVLTDWSVQLVDDSNCAKTLKKDFYFQECLAI
ncbi:hypothetical protein DUI87_15434 [Hirundo rustica rustica]|uniref:Uncharacterized protein n=1 Tax=Hirundo rustica rustica TaxID=333673 RepID=A0A3M0K469_HIRRU|nr:hypothetical protein DUI87_15434 [Hirundo rustica rustica]